MFQLRAQHDGFPGHCRLCLGHTTPVVDTSRPYDSDGYGGSLYVCINCCTEFAQIIGWISPDKAAELNQYVDSTMEQINDLDREVRELRDFKAAVVLGLESDESNVKNRSRRK